MEATTDDAPSHPVLTRSLARIATDPDRVRHLHRLLGPFCHEARNILNGLKMSLYLARRGGDQAPGAPMLSILEGRYQALERLIDRLHQLCRPWTVRPLTLPLHLLFEERRDAWSRRLAGQGRRLVLECPEAAVVTAFDPGCLGPALDDLIDWRARSGREGTDLRLSWRGRDAAVEVDWSEVEREGAPSHSEAPPRAASGKAEGRPDGTDALDLLALPLLARAVALHGGTIETTTQDGWRLRMRWPMTASSPIEARPCQRVSHP